MKMKMLLAAMALPVGASPAVTQDLVFSNAPTLACLAGAEGLVRLGCIGASAQVCMATPAGGSTVGMGYCLSRELGYWDERLNANYAALRRQERALAVEMAALDAHVPDSLAALREMQRAWMGYRDAVCTYEYSTWGGGTGGGPAHSACLLSLTGEQALMLEDELKERFQ